jgi:RHS repeat-associated protein
MLPSVGFSLILAVVPQTLTCQTTVGIQPLGSYQATPIDTVSLSDLGVHISLPLYTHKARGKSHGLAVTLGYESATVGFSGFGTTDMGWNIGVSSATGGSVGITDISNGDCSGLGSDGNYHVGNYDEYTYTFSDSTQYGYYFAGYSTVANNCAAGWSTTSLNERAADGSGYLLSATGLSAMVTDISGSKFVPNSTYNGSSVMDSNGNVGYQFGGFEGPYPIAGYFGTYTDDSGVSVTLSGGGYTVDQNNQPASRNPAYVKYTDTTGATQTITINYVMYSVWAGTGAGKVGLVDSVVYPDGSAYRFTYQPSPCQPSYSSGFLQAIQMPTGGNISFQNAPCGSSGTLSRTTSDGTTAYTYVVNAKAPISQHPIQTTTTVTHPDGSQEVIHFVISQINVTNAVAWWPSLETAHSWITPQGTTIKSTMKCYNGATGNCTTTAVTYPVTQIATTSTISTGASSKTVEYRNANGLNTEVDEYDYSASTPTRKTVTAYATLGNNIVDRPSTITVYDGASNVMSQTTFSYDEYALASSGVSGLGTISGSRGNATTIQKRLTASSSSSTHTHYDNAGQVVSTTDANGNVTSYTHDASDTYVASKIYPAVAAGTFSEVYTPDSHTGLTVQSKDINGGITGYAYDSMLRKIGVCHPDHGYTRTTYVSPSTQTVAVLTGTGTGCTVGGSVPTGTWATTITQYDGYGREIHATDPAGDIIDTSYDSMGRKYSESNPHASGVSANGTAYYLYDSLGRMVKQTDQDGSVQYWCYDNLKDTAANQPNCHPHIGSKTGSWIDYQNQNSSQWQQTLDTFGRLIEVVEPNGVTSVASLETDYTYDALDDLLSVTQCGGLCPVTGALVRSFSYDNQSHLVCASNPENSSASCPATAPATYLPGTTAYSYDSNGNTLVKTSPAVNAGSGTQTIGYCYDALNRKTQKFYNGSFNCSTRAGSAATQYTYDTSTIAGAANTKGNLTDEKAYLGSTLISERSPFQFDAMGREMGEKQTPYSPNGSSYLFVYGYDLAGNMTCGNNGLAVIAATTTCASFAGVSASILEHYTYNTGSNRLQYAQTALQPTSFATPPVLLQANAATAYDTMGHLVNAQLGLGTINGIPAIQLTRQYDNRGRMTTETDGSLHSFSFPSGTTEYDHVGNLKNYTDSALGTWTASYDSLNRLVATSSTAGTYSGEYGCWTYDSFGNRSLEAFTMKSTTPCAPGAPIGSPYTVTTPTSKNQVTGFTYDAAGDVIGDGRNNYAFDPEGRICAKATGVAGGGTLYTEYIYDAEGRRVAKVPGSSRSCAAPTQTPSNIYLLGLGDEQVTELNGSGTVLHSNIFVNGGLLATYDFANGGLHYAFGDPVGTKRTQVKVVQTTPTSTPTATAELNCLSLPFGNSLTNTFTTNCVPVGGGGADATEHHFTGRERDTETGNDYLEARYYSSAAGRFLSPDDGSDQNPLNPQSWNLYSYGRNNPLAGVDPDGRQYTVCDANHQNCTSIDDKTFEADEDKDRKNGEYFQNGKMFHFDEDHNRVNDGTYRWDGPDAALTPEQFGWIGNEGMGAVKFFGEQMLYNAAGDGLLGLGRYAFEASPLAVQIGRNALKGALGEKTVSAMLRLRGFRVVGGQVTVRTSKGIRYVDYIVEKGGEFLAIEVKTGGAVRSLLQLAKDGAMEAEGGLIGKNGGTLIGQVMKLKTIEMRPF